VIQYRKVVKAGVLHLLAREVEDYGRRAGVLRRSDLLLVPERTEENSSSGTDSGEFLMLHIERIEARAYSLSTEDPNRVKTAVLHVHDEKSREKVKLHETLTEGHLQVPILIINSVLTGKKACLETFYHILSSLPSEDISWLRASMERRLDERCVFFLRIDKQASFLGRLQLSKGADLINVQIHLHQYPRCVLDDAKAFILDHLEKHGDS
jgi:RNA binding exosome subunit